MSRMAGGPGEPGLGGRVVLSLFFAVFLLIGAGILVALAPAMVRSLATWQWREVPCTIVESRIVDVATGPEVAGWHVRYRYEVDGQAYTGWRLSVHSAVGDARDSLRRSQQLVPGTAATCHVDPDDPADAVLERPVPWVVFALLFPLVFAVIGAGGIWLVWLPRREEPGAAGTARAHRRALSGLGGRTGGIVLGSIFLLVGIGATHALLVRPLLRMFEARDWPSVPATVVSSQVRSHDSDEGTTYSVEITYHYTMDGREYRSNRYSFLRLSTSGRRSKAAIVAAHPPGARIHCFVNPADPTDAVLQRGWTGAMWFGLIPMVFAFAGGGLLHAMAKK